MIKIIIADFLCGRQTAAMVGQVQESLLMFIFIYMNLAFFQMKSTFAQFLKTLLLNFYLISNCAMLSVCGWVHE